MPRWTFENKITLGALIQIAILAAGLVWGYAMLQTTAEAAAKAAERIPGIESRVSTIETRINIGQAAREQFQTETKQVLKEQSEVLSQILQAQAAILARLDERAR